MEAVGAGALESTFMVLKSVWVDSVEVGPRSLVGGDEEEEAERGLRVVVRVRAWLRLLQVRCRWVEGRLGGKVCGGIVFWGRWWGFGR